MPRRNRKMSGEVEKRAKGHGHFARVSPTPDGEPKSCPWSPWGKAKGYET